MSGYVPAHVRSGGGVLSTTNVEDEGEILVEADRIRIEEQYAEN